SRGALMCETGRSTFRTLILLMTMAAACCAVCAQDASNAATPANAASKPKKIWTNDDFAATAPDGPGLKPKKEPAKPAENNARLARELRARLDRLEGQLKEAQKQLQQLKDFQAGEGNGTTGHQLHKGYNITPVPEQIAKLQN